MYLTGILALYFIETRYEDRMDLFTYFKYICRALHAQSNSKKLKAVIHTTPSDDPKTKTKYFLEVWSNEKLLQSFDLCALNLHGPVYSDGMAINATKSVAILRKILYSYIYAD